ncbi:ChaN family lipoprotein [Aquirufa sp. ROCK2-A2]
MKNLLLWILLLFISPMLYGKDLPAYQLFDAKGKKISFEKMLKKLVQQDVVLVGELHNNAISHWMELEITKACQLQRSLVLGAEMFEHDNQNALNNYLQGKISAKGLDSSARLWKNYPTDYAPLVNFAKEQKIAFIATNIPRKFASLVSKQGFEALEKLSVEEKTWIAPLPIPYDAELPGYKKMLTMMGEHTSPNMPKAQASKDATMAHFIDTHLGENQLFIHYNGSYHSENFEGISWYLKKSKPTIKIATIATVSQKELKNLEKENRYKADFILCVDEDMTNTY